MSSEGYKMITSKVMFSFLLNKGIRPEILNTQYGKLEYIDFGEGKLVRLVKQNGSIKNFIGCVTESANLYDAAEALSGGAEEAI